MSFFAFEKRTHGVYLSCIVTLDESCNPKLAQHADGPKTDYTSSRIEFLSNKAVNAHPARPVATGAAACM